MKNMLRTYRIPLGVTGLMVAAMLFWAWRAWQDIQTRDHERQQQFAKGVSDTIVGTLQALAHDGKLPPEQSISVLNSIIRHSPARFVVLLRDGRRILQAGEAPESLTLPAAEGELIINDRFVYWHPVRLQGESAATRPAAGNPADLYLGEESQTLVLGFSADPRPEGVDGNRMPTPIRVLVFTVAIALLFVAASLLAWIMTIRSRLLAEQLNGERVKRAHLEELGLAAAGLAHETKNPLGIISGIAQRVAADPAEPPQNRQLLEHVLDEVDKASARLGDFLAFARQRDPAIAPVDARTIATKVTAILRPDFDAAGIALRVDCPTTMILADDDMLRQILVNLLLNSLHASTTGGEVTVMLTGKTPGGQVALAVRDDGCGIAPDLLPSIFKPYVAGNPAGHGLGLAIVKRLIDAHGWTISAESAPGAGTTMTISGVELARGWENPS